MFKIAVQLLNTRKIIKLSQQVKLPLSNIARYPQPQYNPQERETCPKPEPPPPPKPKDDSAFWGALTIAFLTAGFAYYAKNTPEVRDWLIIQAPWFDDIIAIASQENMTYGEFFEQCLKDLKKYFTDTCQDGKPRNCSLDAEGRPIISPPTNDNDNVCEIEPRPVVTKNICEIVKCVTDLADDAICSYTKATLACEEYNQLVEETMKNFSMSATKELHTHMAERKDGVDKLLACAEDATMNIGELAGYLECGVQAPKDDIEKTRLLIYDSQQKIKATLIKYQWESDKTVMLDEMWRKVECGMIKYADEIETKYPEVKYMENKLQLDQDVEFLLYHTHRYSQKLKDELNEALSAMTDRVDRGIDTLPQGDRDKKKRNSLINYSLKQKRAAMNKEINKRYEDLRKKNEAILAESLKAQVERHEKSLKINLELKEKEATEKLEKMVAIKVAHEKKLMKNQLSEMAGNLKIIEGKLEAHLKKEREAKRSQELWSAGASLLAATKKGDNCVNVDKELRAIERATGDGDKLVTSVIKSIPQSVKENGVVPESVLKARYYQMEKTALKVALVEEDGSRLPIFFMSWVQYVLLFMKMPGLPQQEIDKPPKEPSKDLDTFDLLRRARYWIEHGNLAAVLRYVNSLEGASRLAAASWNEAAQAHLQIRQAAEALLAHATAMSLQNM